MTSPIIEHLDDFEAEIVAIFMASLDEHRAAQDERRANMDKRREIMRSPAVRRVFADYAEATFRRTGGILPVLMLAGILAVAWVAEQKLAGVI